MTRASKRFVCALATSATCSVLACGGGAPRPAPPSSQSSVAPAAAPVVEPLISRRVLFDNPQRDKARVSPDGKFLAHLAPDKGVLNVWVASLAAPDQARVVTDDRVRGIRRYEWAHDGRSVLYLQDQGGDENWRLYAVDVTTLAKKDLTPLPGVQARLEHVSHRRPGSVLIGLNDRDKRFHDLYELDLASGERRMIAKNDAFEAYVADDDYAVRFAVKPTPDGGSELLRRKGHKLPAKAPAKALAKAPVAGAKAAGAALAMQKPLESAAFEPYLRIAMEDALGTRPLDLDEAGASLFLLDSRERETAALARLDIATKQRSVLAEDQQADVANALFHPTKKTPQAAATYYDQKRWHILDASLNPAFEAIRKASPGDYDIVSRSLDDRHWIVAYTLDTGPVRYFHLDRETNAARFLFSDRPELEKLKLAAMHAVVIDARDKQKLVSYLTLPASVELAGPAKPVAPQPMVLLVHGGPWARDVWGFNSWHQWLANRGYAVLSVNYRGSTGFGKSFVNAANKQWARQMHDDLVDALEWAVNSGVARSDKVAIMGGSYGGYATLVGLTFTPDLFTCGVDIVGPSNLVTLLESIPPYWESYRAVFAERVGDPKTPEGRKLLEERSPLGRVEAIRRPLLIGQGANDPRVKQAESDQIVAAMQKRNIPVTYVLYPDEGHGFVRPENRMSFNAVAEHFLVGCLGGRAEPIGDAFAGASIQVPTGAEYVPGLRQALPAK